MLSSVEADSPKVVVDSGDGVGVVGSAPLWPTTISVNSDWTRSRDQTIEFWFKQDATSTKSYCVLSVGSSNTRKLLIAVNRSNHASYPGKVAFSFSGASGGANLYSANRYDDGQWHHCVIEIFQYGGFTNLYFYFDGQLESNHFRDYPLEFGSWGNTTIGDGERFIPGYVIEGSPIDEIALYDKVIDDERKLAHYNEVMAALASLSVAIAGQIDISGSLKIIKPVRLTTAQIDISGAVKTNKLVRLTTAQFDISGSLLVGNVVRLNTAQFDVDGFISTLIIKGPLPFSISSQIDIFGNAKAALVGKEVAASTRMQSNELDTIVQTGIGVRI